MLYQRTVKKPVALQGIGLHTGEAAAVELSPAPAGTGIVFRVGGNGAGDNGNKGDNGGAGHGGREIKAVSANVGETSYATTLAAGGIKIRTVEHLLAALAGLNIDNAYIDIDGTEVPIMDGSARPFVEAIREAGIKTLAAHRRYIKVVKPVTVRDGDKSATLLPSPVARITCRIDFDHPLIADQEISVDLCPDSFERELAGARTFGFLKDIEMLEMAGLAKGASLENAVVVGEEHILNPGGLRCPDEFVRHKALDMVGDLSLAGMPIIAHIVADKPGHQLNHRLVKALLADRDAWMVLEAEPEMAESGLAAAM